MYFTEGLPDTFLAAPLPLGCENDKPKQHGTYNSWEKLTLRIWVALQQEIHTFQNKLQ